MKENHNFLTLVIASSTYPAVRNMKMQKKIYKNIANENLQFLWYRGGTDKQLNGRKYHKIGNDLFLDINDDTINMGRKTLLAFEWALDNIDFDFIVRPTPSSYVNYENLNKYINNNFKKQEIVYGGTIQDTKDKYGNKIKFASGSTLILNKRCVEIIVENQNLWDHDYWDDVGLALLLRELNIPPSGGERFDVQGNPYKQKINLDQYQYRCRSDNHYGYPRLIESHSLRAINKLFEKGEFSFIESFFKSLVIEVLKLFYVYQFGWKVFTIIKFILKKLLPKKIFKFLKGLLKNKIDSFKHKRFKT